MFSKIWTDPKLEMDSPVKYQYELAYKKYWVMFWLMENSIYIHEYQLAMQDCM